MPKRHYLVQTMDPRDHDEVLTERKFEILDDEYVAARRDMKKYINSIAPEYPVRCFIVEMIPMTWMDKAR